MTERLTIALPVYKRTDFIRQALDSAINQTVKCSILLIDNNSPHHEFKEILDRYHYPHAEIRQDPVKPFPDKNFNNIRHTGRTPGSPSSMMTTCCIASSRNLQKKAASWINTGIKPAASFPAILSATRYGTGSTRRWN